MTERIYGTIIVKWSDGRYTWNELKMHDVTVEAAIIEAAHFGYRKPKWYNPWHYFTGQLQITTFA